MDAFIHGFLLAFGLILPLGVQNVFVFNQGANQPTLFKAAPVIITAAICDTMLIAMAVLGVSVLVLKLNWLNTVLYGLGIIFLIYMGWATWRSTVGSNAEEQPEAMPPKKQILFAASVSLLNPHAILDTVGVIGTSSLHYSGNDKWLFALAAILVSWFWFIGLALAGRLLGKKDGEGKWLKGLNKISALIIWGTAVYLVHSLI
ncbi:LysE/ArgO family amino acid transporter [Desulfotomaculum sp. 1211_IL3151]|uniref:LysE/ArgO family amino acid transporter n=1 Tax=Desulfotomaculum sp. 1211_IL3151 TaxID=3084055 RepID=UPI002FDAEBE3